MKVVIRAMTRDDVDALHEAVRSSMQELSEWLPWCHPGYSREDARRWVDFGLDCWLRGSEFPMGVFDESGRLLGGVGLSKIDRVNRIANLGYWVRTDVMRSGVATEAARQMMEYGLRELGFKRIEIVVLPDNLASIRVAQKLGAVDEGIVEAKAEVFDELVDARVFSLSEESV